MSALKPTAATATQNWRQRLAGVTPYQWVLFSQLFVILPHAKNLPIWLTGYGLAVVLLQLPPSRHWLPLSWYRPRSLRFVQYSGFIVGLVGLYLTYRTAFGLDVGIAFLLLCAVSKLLELQTRRDAYVALTLSMFVLAGLFLIDQTLLTSLIVAVGAMAVLFAMIGMNDDGSGRFRTLGLLVAQAIPLTIVLFLFFPRLPPLWSVHLSGQNQATTGVSDSMSPGDIANLSKSSELAFRVEFEAPIPPRGQLYWRGLVFSQFDGTTWRQAMPSRQVGQVWLNDQPAPTWLAPTLALTKATNANAATRYRVILERTGQPWLFGLDYPVSNQQGIGLLDNFTLRNWEDVTQRFSYQVYWINDAPIGLELTPQERQLNLQLPIDGNTQSREFATQLFNQVGRDPVAYVNALHHWIRTQPFRYTLSPPPLNQNRIDTFLFQTRAGFCEHYSSSFTFLMRAVGIPARVVVGYQGGQLGRDGNSWEVRQMDAHAWGEIWLAGRGWVRVDPTGFVAPERIEQGMDSLTEQVGPSLFGEGTAGELAFQQFQMLRQVRRLFDQASYYWQRDVIGYDQERQQSSLLKWFNIQSLYQQILTMVVASIVLLTAIAVWLWWRRRQVWHDTDRLMVQLSRRLAKHNAALARGENEGVLHWLQRLAPNVTEPDTLQQISQGYRQARYSNKAATTSKHHNQLKQLTRQIKPISPSKKP